MKRNNIKIIVAGFTALYLICMILSTYLAKINIEHEFEKNIETVASDLQSAFNEIDSSIYYSTTDENQENLRNYIYYLLSTSIDDYDYASQKYQQLSAAVYDVKSQELFAETTNIIGDYKYEDNSKAYYYYPIQEHFSEIQQNMLLNFYNIAERMNEHVNGFSPTYIVTLFADSQSKELLQIHLYHTTSNAEEFKSDGKNIFVDNLYSHVKWGHSLLDSMTLKDLESTDTETSIDFHLSKGVNYPYLTDRPKPLFESDKSFETAKEAWKKWMNDEYLQNFPENFTDITADLTYDRNYTAEELKEAAYCSDLYLKYSNVFEPSFYLCIRQTTNSWGAAMDYLKFIYLGGLLITIGCILGVIYSNNKYYQKRAALEDTRRDFTNAIAHELKTPLGIIRSFAENTLENTVEEKREYYQKQIIAQTEEMDKLIQEMIYISKLDSETIEIKKESLSLTSIIKEQLTKLEPLTKEKKLEVKYNIEADLLFTGDKPYIERAVWNLLVNAIEYNQSEGTILICITDNYCSIENTGTPISNEDLPHVFEMLYTCDKSRTSKTKHMGLGLYLADKIFFLHNLKLSICNTQIGVKVTISK